MECLPDGNSGVIAASAAPLPGTLARFLAVPACEAAVHALAT